MDYADPLGQAERIRRDNIDKMPYRELVKVEHYEVPGLVTGYGVKFHYRDGHVVDFPPHKLSAGG